MVQPTVLIVHRNKHKLHHRQDEIFERLASHGDVVAIKPKWHGKCAILSVWVSLLMRAATRKPVGVCWTGDLTVAAFAKELKALGVSRKFVYDDPDFFPLDYSGGVLGVVVSRLDQRIIKGVDLIVSCTPQLTRLRSKQGARKALTIRDGVDTTLFKQCFEDRLKKCDKSEFRPRILLYSGLFGFDKGLDILPKALAIVLERHSRTDLLITGSGRPSFLRKFHDMGLTNHIKFLGRVPRGMLPDIFLRADIGLSLGNVQL